MESQYSAVGLFCTALGITTDNFLLGVDVADFFSFNLAANPRLELTGVTDAGEETEDVEAVVALMASSCCAVNKIIWNP